MIGSVYDGSPSIAEVRPIKYPAVDGLEIPAYLSLPPGRPAKNLPVIVFTHGGPQARDTLGFDWWAQALAAGGYAALAGVSIQSGIYRCAVAVAAVSDPADALGRTQGIVRRETQHALLGALSGRRGPRRQEARPHLAVEARRSDHGAAAADSWPRGFNRADERSATRLQMLQASMAFLEKYNPPD